MRRFKEILAQRCDRERGQTATNSPTTQALSSGGEISPRGGILSAIMANDASRLLGQNGSQELSSADGSTTFDPPAVSIHALNAAAATFTTLTDANQAGTQRLTSLAASDTIYGTFTVVHVATGEVRCNF